MRHFVLLLALSALLALALAGLALPAAADDCGGTPCPPPEYTTPEPTPVLVPIRPAPLAQPVLWLPLIMEKEGTADN